MFLLSYVLDKTGSLPASCIWLTVRQWSDRRLQRCQVCGTAQTWVDRRRLPSREHPATRRQSRDCSSGTSATSSTSCSSGTLSSPAGCQAQRSCVITTPIRPTHAGALRHSASLTRWFPSGLKKCLCFQLQAGKKVKTGKIIIFLINFISRYAV